MYDTSLYFVWYLWNVFAGFLMFLRGGRLEVHAHLRALQQCEQRYITAIGMHHAAL